LSDGGFSHLSTRGIPARIAVARWEAGMKNGDMSREELTKELEELRRRVSELEGVVAGGRETEETSQEYEVEFLGPARESTDGRVIVQENEIKYVDRTLLRMFGLRSEGEMLGRPFADFTAPEHRDLIENRGSERDKGVSDTTRFRFRALKGDGTDFLAELSAKIVPYEDGTAIHGVVRDVTGQERYGGALRKDSIKFESLSKYAPYGLVLIAPDGTFLYVNPRFRELFGYDPAEIPNGKRWFGKAFPNPEYRRKVISAWLADLERADPGEQLARIFRTVCKDGSVKTIHFRPVRLETGEYLMTCEDITSQVKSEQALLESKQAIEALVNATGDFVVMLDSDGTFLMLNEAMARRFGKTIDEILGKTIFDFLPPHLAESRKARLDEVVRTGKSVRFQDENQGAAFDSKLCPVLDSHGNVTAVAAFVRDVTEAKRAEQKLQSSLREKEVLLREVHHRVKNNLQIMSSLLRIQARHAKDRAHRSMLEEGMNRVKSMALAHEMLHRSQSIERIFLRRYVRTLSRYLVTSLRGMEGSVDLKEEIEDISVGPETAIPLGLILTELLSNCLKHAFPAGDTGNIRVALSRIGEYELELIVADDGVGIPEDTDLNNPHTLGLELVNILARQLGGKIEIRKGKGTEVHARFLQVDKP
jgi:PAS domain S-box-containing protein